MTTTMPVDADMSTTNGGDMTTDDPGDGNADDSSVSRLDPVHAWRICMFAVVVKVGHKSFW